MKTEEKAKAYDEALNWMRELYPGLHGATKEDAEHYFPELRESEDERIRKGMIRFLESEQAEGMFTHEARLSWIAYLEKQKDHFRDDTKMVEQKPAEDKAFEEWIDDWWKHNKVNNPDSYDKGDEIQFDEKGFKNFCRGIRNMYANQESAEWSEEDEKMLQRIIRHTESEYQDWCNDKYGNSEIVSDGKRSCLERLDWLEKRLKSLRPQPHKEIYQAAKRDLAIKFMNYLDENRPEGKMSLSNGECEDIDKAFKEGDWAKIIRYIKKYQPHWKPSNEQMNHLCAAVDAAIRKHNESVSGYEPARVLKSLYEQLQKLM